MPSIDRIVAHAHDAAASVPEPAELAICALEGGRDVFALVDQGGGFGIAIGQLVVPTLMSLALLDSAMDVRVFEVDEPDGLAQLSAGELDLLLSERPVTGDHARPPAVSEIDLVDDPLRIAVPESWPVDLAPGDLLARPWVLPVSHDARRRLERQATRHGLTLDVRHFGRESLTMLALVRAGVGAAVIPQLTFAEYPQPGVRPYAGSLDIGSRTLTLLRPLQTQQPAALDTVARELARQATIVGARATRPERT